MNYLMEGARQQIENEIRDIYDALQALYMAGIHEDNAGKRVMEKRLEELGKELTAYEE